MYKSWLAIVMLVSIAACAPASDDGPADSEYASMQAIDGFLDLYWDEEGGRLFIRVEELGAEILYQSSLPRGVGSNDLGLDRSRVAEALTVENIES